MDTKRSLVVDDRRAAARRVHAERGDGSRAVRALVVEGGGMRGAYAAGVLVGLHDAGERFDAVYASSSGACSAAYLHAGQREGVRIWETHLHGRRLMDPWRVARGKPFLDLDYLVDEVFGRTLPLDLERLRAAPAPLWVTLTRASDGAVEYRDLRRERDPLRVLKGTAALPIAHPRPIEIDGARYLDGGMADPIPVLRAIGDGATHVTAVLTKPAGHRRAPAAAWLSWFGSLPYPGARVAFATLHEKYNAALDALDAPPPGVTIRAVRPPPDLRLSRLMTKKRLLKRAVNQGARDALLS